MFGNSRYFGLTGTRLNIAIGVLAGVDFWQVPGIHISQIKKLMVSRLFGYDQGVMGGLLDLRSFVERPLAKPTCTVINWD
jgi:hypothetical protein